MEGLTIPLKLPYEDKIFDRNFDKPWEAIMRRFRVSVAEIEKMTEVFIKESFRKLRSAEGAFELVQNFQKIGADDGQSAPGAGGPGESTPILNCYLFPALTHTLLSPKLHTCNYPLTHS